MAIHYVLSQTPTPSFLRSLPEIPTLSISFRKTKRNTVAEILEGEGDEQPVDADEAMEDFPFALEGDGDKAPKEPGRRLCTINYSSQLLLYLATYLA